MTRVVKGNTELRVPDSEVTTYLNQGYVVIGANGKLVQVSKSFTYDELVTFYKHNERTIKRQGAKIDEQNATIAEKDITISSLNAEVERLNAIIAAGASKTSADGGETKTQATTPEETKTPKSTKKA